MYLCRIHVNIFKHQPTIFVKSLLLKLFYQLKCILTLKYNYLKTIFFILFYLETVKCENVEKLGCVKYNTIKAVFFITQLF